MRKPYDRKVVSELQRLAAAGDAKASAELRRREQVQSTQREEA